MIDPPWVIEGSEEDSRFLRSTEEGKKEERRKKLNMAQFVRFSWRINTFDSTVKIVSVPFDGSAPPPLTSESRYPQSWHVKDMIMTSLKCGMFVTAVRDSPTR